MRPAVQKAFDEIVEKDFIPVEIEHYKNLSTPLLIKCQRDHEIEASLSDIRKASFRCDRCGGGTYNIVAKPPQKKGTRVMGIDNATQNMGISIFDDGKLVFQTLIKIGGSNFEDRIQTIFNMMEHQIIKEWEPDYMIFEDIQYQNNYQTYKKLAMLLGLLIVAAQNAGVKWEVVPPVTWRSHFGISGKRETVKKQAISKIATMYQLDVTDDIAEAILIGQYYVEKILAIKQIKKAF